MNIRYSIYSYEFLTNLNKLNLIYMENEFWWDEWEVLHPKLKISQVDKDLIHNLICHIIQQTRIDTLRQVLPNKVDVRWNEAESPISIARESGNYGRNECIEDIEDKAKELWGIDLTKLN